ncbi:hypothetical protein [Pontibacterium sp.]|uniref:hypothetical protein n=1 Tax=Pontibacterium sp. TaxID=2036026 RepID=UPI0035661B33
MGIKVQVTLSEEEVDLLVRGAELVHYDDENQKSYDAAIMRMKKAVDRKHDRLINSSFTDSQGCY